MAEINSEVGGFSHSGGKSRKGKKVLAQEHRNLIVPVAEVFFLLKKKICTELAVHRRQSSLVQIIGNSAVGNIL